MDYGSIAAIAVFLGALSSAAIADDKRQVREQAEAAEARMRAQGEPQDRCFLSANVADGPVVIRAAASSPLRPGDKLVQFAGKPTVGQTADGIVAMLRQTAPDAVVPIQVDRGGQLVDLTVTCTNARPVNEATLLALDAAGRGRFDDCVDTVNEMNYVDTGAAVLRATCAGVSRNSEDYNVPSLLAQAMEMAIADAQYAMSNRTEVARQLRNVEGVITRGLGAARYQALVEATKRWPGGEAIFASSAPDWSLFRRNAETALRSTLIDPESARIQWTHGFLLGTWKPFFSKVIEGYWSCGLINARNRMGGYTGNTAFVVVLDPSGSVKYSQIGESKDYDMLTASCNNSIKLLPPAPPELLGDGHLPAARPASLADELQKLVDLRNSGALTEEEFQAAKQRLLAPTSR